MGGFRLKFGLGLGRGTTGRILSTIKWLLGFNLNTTATVGPSAVDGYSGVNRYPRIWDATLGLVLPSGGIAGSNPISEGMRLATTFANGAELADNLITDVADRTFTSDTGFWSVGAGWSIDDGLKGSATTNSVSHTFAAGNIGKRFRVIVDIQEIVSGSVRYFWGGAIISETHVGADRFIIEAVLTSNAWFSIDAVSSFNGTISLVSIEEVLPTFLNGENIDVAMWGDSLTEGLFGTSVWADKMAPALPYATLYNGGVGADTSTQIKTRMIADTSRYGDVTVIWAGRNNRLDPTTIKADIATMVAALTTPKFIVLAITNARTEPSGSPSYISITGLNADLLAIYGGDYLDIRTILVGSYNPSLPQDVIDFGNDVPPDSLMFDNVHPNGDGNEVVAASITSFLVSTGHIPTSLAGTPRLTPTKTLNGADVYLVYQPWTDSVVVPAGGVLTDFDGVQCKYYSSILGGTTSGTGVADDTGVTDWVEQGNYNNIQKTSSGEGWLTHVLNEPGRTNELLNSDSPATQTTASLITGDYVLWQNGAGSSDLTAGTATISTTGSATDGSPLTFTVTGAGTVTVTIVGGPPDEFQLEEGSIPTSFILTAGGSVQRNVTEFTVPNPLPVNDFQMRFRLVVNELGNPIIFDAEVDPDNEFYMQIVSDVLRIRADIGGDTKTANSTVTLVVGTVHHVGISYSIANGMSISVNSETPVTTAVTEELVYAATLRLMANHLGEGGLAGGITDLTIRLGTSDWYKDTTWSQP